MRFFRTLRRPGILVLAAASLGLNLVGTLAAADRANVTSVTGISGSPGFRAMAKAFATGDAKTGAGARVGSDLLALKAEYEDRVRKMREDLMRQQYDRPDRIFVLDEDDLDFYRLY